LLRVGGCAYIEGMPDDNSLDLRLSNQDRDVAVNRLQAAFLEGRLTDAELADRVDQALAARLQGDLIPLFVDLPAAAAVPDRGPAPPPLKKVSTHKSWLVQQGVWTVPKRFKASSYKSTQRIDLTRAVLTSDRTEIRIEAYKSEIAVVVPAGTRVELRGAGYQSVWIDETQGEGSGPVIVVRGSAYKSHIVVQRG
jgi:hypothetical protein